MRCSTSTGVSAELKGRSMPSASHPSESIGSPLARPFPRGLGSTWSTTLGQSRSAGFPRRAWQSERWMRVLPKQGTDAKGAVTIDHGTAVGETKQVWG